TLSAILKDTPPPLHLPEAERHPEVQHILTRALAKETDQRYQNMKELVADLRQLRDELASGKRARQPLWPKVAGAAALAVALVFGGWWYARRHTAAPAARQPVSVLVADFQNKTDLPVFDGALEQAIAIGLEGAPFISSYSRPQARKQATELDAGAAGRLDQRLAQLVGRSQGIKVAVAGSIEPKGEGFLLKAWAVDVVTSQNVAEASKTVSSKADVLKAADGLATELRSDLGDTTIEGQALEGETFTTTSLDAMNSYARAQELQGLGKYEEAMTELRKAIAQDPDMGRAYAGLGAMLGNMGERDEAEKYYQMALSRLDRMTEREKRRTRGGYFLTVGHDAQKAIDEYGALVAQYPADTAGHTNLALAYFYAGDMKRALDEGRRAVELFPKSVPHRTNLALYALYAGDFDTVERETKEVLAQNASFEKAHLAMALAEMARNRPKQAAEIYGRLNTVSARGASLAAIGLADLALYEGRPGEAIGSLEKGIAGDVANRNNAAAAIKSAVLAGALLLRGQTAAALAAADEATKGSRNEAVASLAARVYVAAGRDAKALALASELSGRLQPAPQAYAKLINAAVHTARGRVREAIPLLQEARTRTDTWLGRFELGRAYVEAGAFAEADSELETCLKRSGEATAAFLDDVPTARFLPPVHYYLGRAKEGLKSPRAADSFRTFLAIKENAEGDPLVTDLRRRLPVR
ncbi:MAG TPA: tetratricopeptide repeat protein, partial [Micromonosporaceae bacterium]